MLNHECFTRYTVVASASFFLSACYTQCANQHIKFYKLAAQKANLCGFEECNSNSWLNVFIFLWPFDIQRTSLGVNMSHWRDDYITQIHNNIILFCRVLAIQHKALWMLFSSVSLLQKFERNWYSASSPELHHARPVKHRNNDLLSQIYNSLIRPAYLS